MAAPPKQPFLDRSMSGVTLPSGPSEAEDLGQCTQRILAWVAPVAAGFKVLAGHGPATPPPDAVVIRLADLAADGRPKEATAALRLTVDYAVEVMSADVLRAMAVLGEIAFLALADPDVELLGGRPGLEGRTGLHLRTFLRRTRAVRHPVRVREPLRVALGPAAAIDGIVLGPGDRPVAGAELSLRALGLRTVADADGRFRFYALPPPPTPLAVVVQTRGTRADAMAQAGEYLIIRIPSEA